MSKEAIGMGSTIEEAFQKACQTLGVKTDKAACEIMERPEKKLFGLLGSTQAKVRAFIKDEPVDAAIAYLKTILNNMGVNQIEIHVEENEEGATISLLGEDIGFLIGHRGETLDALQYLSGLVANQVDNVDNTYHRIFLNIGNFREKRKDTLDQLGRKIARKALKSGRNYSLEPMNPYERHIIHAAVQVIDGVKSWSEGIDLARHIVIGPEEGEKSRNNNYYNHKKNYNNQENSRYNPIYDSKTYHKGLKKQTGSLEEKFKKKLSSQPVKKNWKKSAPTQYTSNKTKAVDEELESASYQNQE